jgi:hypothetical protein
MQPCSTPFGRLRHLVGVAGALWIITASTGLAGIQVGTPSSNSEAAMRAAVGEAKSRTVTAVSPVPEATTSRIIRQEAAMRASVGRARLDAAELAAASPNSVNSASAFHWTDAALGAAAGIGIGLMLAIAVMFAWRTRRPLTPRPLF